MFSCLRLQEEISRSFFICRMKEREGEKSCQYLCYSLASLDIEGMPAHWQESASNLCFINFGNIKPFCRLGVPQREPS